MTQSPAEDIASPSRRPAKPKGKEPAKPKANDPATSKGKPPAHDEELPIKKKSEHKAHADSPKEASEEAGESSSPKQTEPATPQRTQRRTTAPTPTGEDSVSPRKRKHDSPSPVAVKAEPGTVAVKKEPGLESGVRDYAELPATPVKKEEDASPPKKQRVDGTAAAADSPTPLSAMQRRIQELEQDDEPEEDEELELERQEQLEQQQLIREMLEELKVYHPCFPQLPPLRCRERDPWHTIELAVARNKYNNGREYFRCQDCRSDLKFICWADDRGVGKGGCWCDCGRPAREDITTRGTHVNTLFYACATGHCRYFYPKRSRVLTADEVNAYCGRHVL
ncbi:hypothetical protein GGR52DRAFT_548463 [Hypoxylon sp. FL1284]|nr:hypothetical protein GGR52DRAFT_548463 [Hypoxylon sp. FL1284]